MVHRAPEIQDLLIKVNLPFDQIPEGIVRLASYDPLTWTIHGWRLDRSYTNLSYWANDTCWIALWGPIDPLEKSWQIVKFVIHPIYRGQSTEIYKKVLQDVRQYASVHNLDTVYWITTRPKTFLKKLDGDVRQTNANVIEVV